jgi:hypothetical protein
VTEIVLQRSRIVAVIGELVPASMPEHMRVNAEKAAWRFCQGAG